ncbi:MAG: penicillin-binding protein, partial [Paraburkholderia sp.]|nr:penicillin-binding protein [Paraburkholderia sp.]
AIAWVGHDSPRSLGDRETGGGIALPIWMDYMREALKGVPEYSVHPVQITAPADVVLVVDELYFDTFMPGQGFIQSIGGPDEVQPEAGDVRESAIASSATGAESTFAREAVSAVTAEAQRAMNLLEGR